MNHRCAVCWEFFKTHEEWYEHAERQHGAILGEFGYDICQNVCPGEEHMRLKREGAPTRAKSQVPVLEYVAGDGTRYIQQHLV